MMSTDVHIETPRSSLEQALEDKIFAFLRKGQPSVWPHDSATDFLPEEGYATCSH